MGDQSLAEAAAVGTSSLEASVVRSDSESDKSYWHRYVDFYEDVFETAGRVSSILEFGVLDGDSIRWLADRFPEARIVGCDIIPVQEAWPVSPRIEYATVDQASVEQLRSLFGGLDRQFDLIIDDGSHQPIHQRNCLVESLPYISRGGTYILEDIHTSHPAHQLYRDLGDDRVIGPLHLLLALEHLHVTGTPLSAHEARQLSSASLFTLTDVERVNNWVRSIEIFKRTTLPHRCYQCGRSDFDYASLRCVCGTGLYLEPDSMSAVLRGMPSRASARSSPPTGH